LSVLYLPSWHLCALRILRCPGRKQFLRQYLGYAPNDFPILPPATKHHKKYIRITVQMSRPSVKLCADCFPGALRPRGVRTAPLRGVARERTYATQRGFSPAVANCSTSALPARTQGSQLPLRSKGRGLTTTSQASHATLEGEKKAYTPPTEGPLKEYDTRVQEGRLRDDPYQRGRRISYKSEVQD
jgi:hypothetical protein